MGRWLNDIILQAAHEVLQDRLPARQDDPVVQLGVRLEELAEEVRAIRKRQEVGPMVRLKAAWRRTMVALTPRDVGPGNRPGDSR
jgi:hypothetical protein